MTFDTSLMRQTVFLRNHDLADFHSTIFGKTNPGIGIHEYFSNTSGGESSWTHEKWIL